MLRTFICTCTLRYQSLNAGDKGNFCPKSIFNHEMYIEKAMEVTETLTIVFQKQIPFQPSDFKPKRREPNLTTLSFGIHVDGHDLFVKVRSVH